MPRETPLRSHFSVSQQPLLSMKRNIYLMRSTSSCIVLVFLKLLLILGVVLNTRLYFHAERITFAALIREGEGEEHSFLCVLLLILSDTPPPTTVTSSKEEVAFMHSSSLSYADYKTTIIRRRSVLYTVQKKFNRSYEDPYVLFLY